MFQQRRPSRFEEPASSQVARSTCGRISRVMFQQRIQATAAVKLRRRVRVFSSPPSTTNPRFPAEPSSTVPENNAAKLPSTSRNNPPPKRSLTHDHNIRLHRLGRSKIRLREARKLFDEMPQRDAFSYATMISAYLRNHDLPSAELLFLSVPEDSRSVAAETAMIGGYARAGRLEDARKVFDEMPHRNVCSWTCLMAGYFGNGQVEEGRKVFDQMPVKNVVSWTGLVQGYARNGLIDVARVEFDRMPERNVVSWTVMIGGCVDNGRVDEALELFRQCPLKNLYTWHVIVSGLLANQRIDEAVQFFNSMPTRNSISWTLMVTGLAENRLINLAREYFDRMPGRDLPAWNSMITAYALAGYVAEAEELFRLTPEKNVVTFNAMIEGYGRNTNSNEAFGYYNLMVRSFGLRPNDNTITSLVGSCRGLMEVAASHSLAMRLGFGKYTVLTNALVTGYSKAGDFSSARDAFVSLECKDVVSYRAIMFACSDHGYGKHTLEGFARMLRLGVEPDEVTFVALLSACARTGMVERGEKVFYSMRVFGLEPRREHYACVVEILGRAGRLEVAVEVIRRMPGEEVDGVVVGALLGACRLQGDLKMSQVGKKLMDHVKGGDSGGFAMLGNTLAVSGKWEELARMKEEMRAREIKRIAGVSQIQVRG